MRIKCCPVGNGPKQVVEEDNQIYNNAGIEVKPDFQEGWINFMVTYQKNYRAPEEEV
jgi:protein TonB